ncbi:TatD family hydrolase [endosymbiont GvMRE of Glomus versiforme]|uniref:TatD family hydrolase n=1 Tax=endosymbiont GvMRE of Glomus versiforme TaxID=2039283 RepID=UPI000EE274B0|nr:TatD family hydrolase [endosymbiont GvMRE of Glomus versiforme]RHZ35397.1 TatD, hydrolase [endosymbiont GvMRE of Glomus versiforme]
MKEIKAIFDTHCHLADEKYRGQDIKKIIQEAKEAGVKYILNTGQDMLTNLLLLTQLKEFSNLYGALGLHPNSEEDLKEKNLQWIEDKLTNKKIIAIGEIGLDYYRTFTPQETQKYWFKKQLELAKKYNLPVLLHIRGKEGDKKEYIKAFWDTYEIVKEVKIKKGILHCFTGDWEIAQKFIDLGFYVSFAGNITYRNAKWKEKWGEALEKMPLERIVIETDAPYLIPEPLRGKQPNNYPLNIIHTLKKIAEIRKIELEKIASKIYSNTCEFFAPFIKN